MTARHSSPATMAFTMPTTMVLTGVLTQVNKTISKYKIISQLFSRLPRQWWWARLLLLLRKLWVELSNILASRPLPALQLSPSLVNCLYCTFYHNFTLIHNNKHLIIENYI